MSMTHKLLASVAVCLKAVSNKEFVFYFSVFGCFVSLVWPHAESLFSSSDASFSFRNPKSIAASLSWHSAISSKRSWLRETRYWFFFSDGCQRSDDHKVWKRKLRKFQKGYIARTSKVNIRLRWWFLLDDDDVLISCELHFAFDLS